MIELNIGDTIYESHRMKDGSIVTEKLTIDNDYDRDIFQFGLNEGQVFLTQWEAERAVCGRPIWEKL